MIKLFLSTIKAAILLLICIQFPFAFSNQYREKSSAIDIPIKTLPKADKRDGLLFFDNFEYSVSRDNSPKNYQIFKSRGGWSHIKAENITGSHAGFLYTVEKIPGFNGRFPGRNSNKVLAMEARSGSMETQSDFYLQYGNGNTPDFVPGDVWFQFWIYPNRYGDQQSTFARNNKLIYPCRQKDYPCTDLNWLTRIGSATAEPYWGAENPARPYISTVGWGANYELAAPENVYKLGQTDISEYLVPNRWTLVKLHYDTSSESGTFEAWLKPMGGKWIKVADWRDGKSPNFTWQIPTDKIGGHRMFRIPTTLGKFDSWTYLDDFGMATSENALPVY